MNESQVPPDASNDEKTIILAAETIDAIHNLGRTLGRVSLMLPYAETRDITNQYGQLYTSYHRLLKHLGTTFQQETQQSPDQPEKL
jgi:hypothetical protein